MGHWHIVNFHNAVATTFKHHISKSNGFNSRLEGIKTVLDTAIFKAER